MGYIRPEPGRKSVTKDNVMLEDFIRHLVEVKTAMEELEQDINIARAQATYHKMEVAKRTFENIQERLWKDLQELRKSLKLQDPSLR